MEHYQTLVSNHKTWFQSECGRLYQKGLPMEYKSTKKVYIEQRLSPDVARPTRNLSQSWGLNTVVKKIEIFINSVDDIKKEPVNQYISSLIISLEVGRKS